MKLTHRIQQLFLMPAALHEENFQDLDVGFYLGAFLSHDIHCLNCIKLELLQSIKKQKNK